MPHPQPVPLKIALLNTPEIELWPAALLRAREKGKVLTQRERGEQVAVSHQPSGAAEEAIS